MISKILTSVIFGASTPFLYFVFVTVSPMHKIDPSGGAPEMVGPGGLLGFIEFHGFAEALVIWAKVGAVCALFTFCVCFIYDMVRRYV